MKGLAAVPLRVRLVAGFAATMLFVLSAAGAFVFWRVRVALDASLSSTLTAQATALRDAVARHPDDPAGAVAEVGGGDRQDQLLDSSGRLLATTQRSSGGQLLPAADLPAARSHRVLVDRGQLLFDRNRRLRVLAFPVAAVRGQPPLVAVTAVRLAQHDEALRELLGQLTIANLAALAIACAVGYRLARAALRPVESYRTQAQQITAGHSSVRLDVPDSPDDEVSRLGHTLNEMLAAQAAAADTLHRFVADASHELRTPLTLLTTEVELALRRPRTAQEYQAALAEIGAATARLSHLANRLLQLEAVAHPGTITAPLSEGLRHAAGRVPGCTVDAAGVHGVDVPMAPAELDTVLGNLVDNAGRYGSAPIRIGSEVVGAAVRITVSDAGKDLDADFVPAAIERFRRADVARTTTGSGLGLSLVHGAVVAAGGELRLCAAGAHHVYPPARFDLACSHDETGTTATVLIPVTSAG